MKIETAILSVSNKEGIAELGRELSSLGINIVSTGGTSQVLQEAGVPVITVSDYTSFPEILRGRVKTLHPRIYGGILARHDDPDDKKALRENDITSIGLIVVNLYPFGQTIEQENVTLDEAIEQIDIGGPTLIRAAAKNFNYATVLVDSKDYGNVLSELRKNDNQVSAETRALLAKKAFNHTASYDATISNYLCQHDAEEETLPATFNISLERVDSLRYGENPHQKAAVYQLSQAPASGLVGAKQYQGKHLSFNNYSDLESAWNLCQDFQKPFCGILKHSNPCGAAVGASLKEAYERALSCDPVSAFGSVIGFNRQVDEETAESMRSLFVEAVIAPSYKSEALEIFAQKKNLRVLEMGEQTLRASDYEVKTLTGGFLLQDRDLHLTCKEDLKVVTKRVPSQQEIQDLLFGWIVCKHVKSNAIVFALGNQTIGIGAGQMSRVDSVRLAATKAQVSLDNSVMASDAFFPFGDAVEEAAQVGAKALIQPGGSIRDKEVIEVADKHNLAMVFTGIRHFKH